jgi:hypothetical protein
LTSRRAFPTRRGAKIVSVSFQSSSPTGNSTLVGVQDSSIEVGHAQLALDTSFRGRDPVFIGRVDARDTRAGHTAREEWRHASLPRFRILGSQLPEKLAYW